MHWYNHQSRSDSQKESTSLKTPRGSGVICDARTTACADRVRRRLSVACPGAQERNDLARNDAPPARPLKASFKFCGSFGLLFGPRRDVVSRWSLLKYLVTPDAPQRADSNSTSQDKTTVVELASDSKTLDQTS